MVSSARASLSALSLLALAAGPFVAAGGNFRAAALEAARGAVLLGFFGISGVPDHAALSGLLAGRKRRK
jgi:hypothetical protein